MPTCHRARMPPRGYAALRPNGRTFNSRTDTLHSKLQTPYSHPFQALSSAGQNSGLIIRESRVRIPQGQPFYNNMNNPSDLPGDPPPTPPSPATKGDSAWLQALLFADGSMLLEYGDGTLIVEGPGA